MNYTCACDEIVPVQVTLYTVDRPIGGFRVGLTNVQTAIPKKNVVSVSVSMYVSVSFSLVSCPLSPVHVPPKCNSISIGRSHGVETVLVHVSTLFSCHCPCYVFPLSLVPVPPKGNGSMSSGSSHSVGNHGIQSIQSGKK